MQDNELLNRYLNGDLESFLVLFRKYRKPLYNFILRNIGANDLAEDLLQDVFLRVIQGAKGFKNESKFSTWLYTIARNRCIDQLRRNKPRNQEYLDEPKKDHNQRDNPNPKRQFSNRQPSVDRQASRQQIQQEIALAVESLPLEQREVFLMRQLQQLPFSEISKIIGVSENTIKSRMRYALERLREALIDYKEYSETP